MNKAIVNYANNKSENFKSWDFLGIINLNTNKEGITDIKLTGNNVSQQECTKFQVFFAEDIENICFYKPWPIFVVNSKFEYLTKDDFTPQYKETGEVKEIIKSFKEAIEKEKKAVLVA